MIIRCQALSLAILFICLLASGVRGATLHVPKDYLYIGYAMDAAVAGDTIQLAAGLHCAALNGNTQYMKSAVVLRGDPGDPASVVVYGGQDRTIIMWEVGPGTLIEGITLQSATYLGGGVLDICDSVVEIRDCIIRETGSHGWGGALLTGAATDALFIRCRFLDICNPADYGEAVSAGYGARVEIRDCLFSGNICPGPAVLFHEEASGLMSNCTLAQSSGVGVVIDGCHVDIENSIFAQNSGGGLMLLGGGTVSLSCCDIFGNEGGDWHAQIAEQLDVNGNFSADPEFCGVIGSGNYYLQSDSPCAPANNDCGLLIGAFPVGCLETVTEARSWGALKALY